MHLARLTAFDHQICLRPQVSPQQMIVDSAQRQERRDECVNLIYATVAQNKRLRAGSHSSLGPIT